MAKKRGLSGLSLVVGVDKPVGLSSHDVVNRCRRIFGERRVGHTGTLDPGASGALTVCVGPAARLDAYLTHDEKAYVARICLGASTDTDDAEGDVTESLMPPAQVLDAQYAQDVLDSFLGDQMQMPPVYSALKVGGQKACDQARKGNVIDLQPRLVRVERATLLQVVDEDGCQVFSAPGYEPTVGDCVKRPVGKPLGGTGQPEATVACEDAPQTYEGLPYWDVEFAVSKGTYIRSLARDLGLRIGCGAHLRGLRRTRCGNLTLDDCVSLETLEQIGARAALDPVVLLGLRFAYLTDEQRGKVSHGNPLKQEDVELCERRYVAPELALCACTSGVQKSCQPPRDQEVVSLIHNNALVALYYYDQDGQRFACKCMFNQEIVRGQGL